MTDEAAPRKQLRPQPDQVDGRTALGRRNRAALIRAAQELFRERDYGAVSIRHIIGRAGVGLGTFYNHFKDKEDLLRLILEESRKTSLDRQHELRAEAKSFPEFIRSHFSFFFHALAEEPAYLAVLRSNAGLMRQIVEGPAHVKGMTSLRDDLDDAIRRGVLGPIDSEYLTGAIRGIAVEVGQAMVRRSPPDPDGATEFAVQLVLGALPWNPR